MRKKLNLALFTAVVFLGGVMTHNLSPASVHAQSQIPLPVVIQTPRAVPLITADGVKLAELHIGDPSGTFTISPARPVIMRVRATEHSGIVEFSSVTNSK